MENTIFVEPIVYHFVLVYTVLYKAKSNIGDEQYEAISLVSLDFVATVNDFNLMHMYFGLSKMSKRTKKIAIVGKHFVPNDPKIIFGK